MKSESQNNTKENANVSPTPESKSLSAMETSSSNSPDSRKKEQIKLQKNRERQERASLKLWRRPMLTLKYCSLEIAELLKVSIKNLLQHVALFSFVIIICIILCIVWRVPARHQLILEPIRNNSWFVVYWVGLGILSSFGMGSGLHTFLLYLGPHIASVTLAAYECNSTNFPRPPYPDDIVCPEEPYEKRIPDMWSIMSKVRLEAFLWGIGTALGELPPYFMAKASRLSGYDPEDQEELAEFEALKAIKDTKNLGIINRGKLFMEHIVEKVGFFGIFACASIPNPLFDLVGITCGHFLVPFWTFFGATLIGKAIVKMHIQKIFVIIAFNETLIESVVDFLGKLPFFGKKLQEPFKGFLKNQKLRLHRQRNAIPAQSGNLLSKIFETFVIGMVCYFVMSIVNSLAQSYHKRIHTRANEKNIYQIEQIDEVGHEL